MTLPAGTYRLDSKYANSSERKSRLAAISAEMRNETYRNFCQAQEERRLARLGIEELRRVR